MSTGSETMGGADETWWDVRAAEYVIGTLAMRERSLFERILRHDESVQADVARWTERLAPLDATTPARQPAPHVWTKVAALVAADVSGRVGEPRAETRTRAAGAVTIDENIGRDAVDDDRHAGGTAVSEPAVDDSVIGRYADDTRACDGYGGDTYADDRPAADGPAIDRLADDRHADDRHADNRHADDRHADNRHADDRYADDRPVADEPAVAGFTLEDPAFGRSRDSGSVIDGPVVSSARSKSSSRAARSSSASSTFQDIKLVPSRRMPIVVGAMSLAAGVLLGIGLARTTSQPEVRTLQADTVAIVTSDANDLPLFHVATDAELMRVRVTALAPPPLEAGSRYQLWQALPDRSSVRPLATLPEEAGLSRVIDVESLVEGSDLFGVSIEPYGADLSGGPTGPVIAHGDAQAVRPNL